jgi:D-aspartate ligase
LDKMEKGTANTGKGKPAALPQRKERVGVVVIEGHFQGLGLLRSLGRRNVPTYLLDTGQCLARYSRYTKKFFKCPDVRDASLFLEFLIDLARRENLKGWLLYPNDDQTVYLLAKNKERLEEYYRVTTPPWDVVKYAYDKVLTYKLAEQCHINIPKTFYPRYVEELEQLDIEFPAIIKPSIKVPFYNNIKKKAIRVDNKEDLLRKYSTASLVIDPSQTLMVQELIPGRTEGLFSVGSLCRNGELLGKVVVRRPRQHPMDFGHATTFAETVDIPELEAMSKTILGAMGYYGLSEVEFMLDRRDRKYKLIEINARAWGWHTIAIGAGVDLPYMSYLDMLGENVRQNGFTKDVKWIRLMTDVPTVAIELLSGRMKFTEYLRSLRGKKQFAVTSLKDPLPSIVELAMLPYLLKKKGFW